MKQSEPGFHFFLYLAVLSIIGFLATDIYLPAFDRMHTDLDTSKANIGLSLTLFLGGFAIAQLLWGPVSDRYGKHRAVLWGMLIFAVSSIALFFVKNIGIFLGLRLIQAIGACAAAVSWQAMVVDYYKGKSADKIFASIMPLVALSPALAPIAGVWVMQMMGWEYIFLILAVISGLLIAYTLTLSQTPDLKTMKGEKQGSYLDFFKSKKYLGNVMVYAACSAGFFAWLTGAPFFLTDLGYSESQIGLSFVPQTITFMIGGYGYRLLSDKIEGRKLLPILLWMYAVCMLIILMMSLFTLPTLTMLLIPFSIMAMANGAIYPIVVAAALKPYAGNSGKASALQNALQLGLCFLASAVVSMFTSSAALLGTSAVMAVTILFAIAGFRLSREKLTAD